MAKGSDTYSEAETIRRRDAAIKRALNTPPEPFTKPAKKKAKPRKKAAQSAKSR